MVDRVGGWSRRMAGFYVPCDWESEGGSCRGLSPRPANAASTVDRPLGVVTVPAGARSIFPHLTVPIARNHVAVSAEHAGEARGADATAVFVGPVTVDGVTLPQPGERLPWQCNE